VARECLAVRNSCGIFDASTLGKIEVVGKDAATFMNRMYVNTWSNLAVGRSKYGVLLRDDGFVYDDGVVARTAENRFHVTTTTGGAARVLALMEEYSQKVKNDNYLQHFAQAKHPIQIQFPQATYVGSEACKKCHEHAYDVWKKSKHAHAFNTLVTATRPKLRQFDGECVICHVTGFEYLTGYRNEQATPHLKDVGCESCHGPGSIHADKKNPLWRNRQLLDLMNPYKTPANETAQQKQQRMLKLHVFCQHCHDTDNDVGWNNPPVKPGEPPQRWHDIIHMNPKE